jgi:hypothetical protein|eukprot:CAMPEP_0169074026 /NCGR_PEP_ID=MMETSP1015-20121227/7054_1 /TAXON_ID=342587 /ORGANISM="Karlodinium micrum, Strain CCMP2283" /LENGTH=228 /DNA_ID=CAMNT_0009133313 /DNA_START=83 /DNA_END=769 /DNA_ORIENTATION=-
MQNHYITNATLQKVLVDNYSIISLQCTSDPRFLLEGTPMDNCSFTCIKLAAKRSETTPIEDEHSLSTRCSEGKLMLLSPENSEGVSVLQLVGAIGLQAANGESTRMLESRQCCFLLITKLDTFETIFCLRDLFSFKSSLYVGAKLCSGGKGNVVANEESVPFTFFLAVLGSQKTMFPFCRQDKFTCICNSGDTSTLYSTRLRPEGSVVMMLQPSPSFAFTTSNTSDNA